MPVSNIPPPVAQPYYMPDASQVVFATTAPTAGPFTPADDPPHPGLQTSVNCLHAAIADLERAMAALSDAAGPVLVGSQLAIPTGPAADAKKDCPAPQQPRSFVRCRIDEAAERVEGLRMVVSDLIGRLDT